MEENRNIEINKVLNSVTIKTLITNLDVDLEILFGMNQTESFKESIKKKKQLKLALRKYLYGEDAV